MKKAYIAPQMEAIGMEAKQMLAASVRVSDEVTENDARMSNGRREGNSRLWD